MGCGAAVSAPPAVPAPAAQRHVVFLQTGGAGHINPTVPLAAALVKHGCKVTFFAPADGPPADRVNKDTPLGQAVLASGVAELRGYRVSAELEEEPSLAGRLNEGWKKLPGLLEDLRQLDPKPSVLLYDPFGGFFAAAGRILGIPAISLIPHSGPGIMTVSEGEKANEAAAGAREWLRAQYKLDLLELGLPPLSWYARGLNLVLTCEELFAGVETEAQRALWGGSDCFHCVGTMNGIFHAAKSLRVSEGEFPLAEIESIAAAGKKVVYMSLGSMVTGSFFEQEFGKAMPTHIQGNTDDTDARVDGKALSAMSGADFARFVFGRASEALGGRDDVLVVLSCGKRGPEAVLKDLGLAETLPSNFRAFGFVPQLELLPLCSCFVTHGGMGSVMESILFRVPVVVVPLFGDQMWNADRVASTGLGFGFRYPLVSLEAGKLRGAVLAVCGLGPGGSVRSGGGEGQRENTYKLAVEAAAAKMEREGGPENAVKLILGTVKET